MTRSRLAWGIAALAILAFLVVRPFHPSGDVSAIVIFGIGIGSFAAVGALLNSRLPANPIGVLLLAAGALLSAAMVIGTYADFGALQVPAWPWTGSARIVQSTLFVFPFMIALIGVPLVFPDGRLPSPRFRWVVWITIADMAAWTFGSLLGGPLQDASAAEIPGSGAANPLLGTLQAFFFVGAIVSCGAGAVAVSLRFRRGDPVQRQQVKWLVAVVGLGAIVLPVSLIVPGDASPELANALATVTVLTLFALPVVIAIAILRYRLFEIDRIISRTIGWAILTSLLGAIYLAVVLVLQSQLSGITQGQTLAVAASTLLAAAVFQPTRRRIQRLVDRQFDRARYDGEQTVAAFAEDLRDQVDLQTISVNTVAAVDAAVRPRGTSLWLREPGR